MKKFAMIAILVLAGCNKPQSQPVQPAAVPTPPLPPLFTPPTATEVFNLRTKCTQLAQELDKRLPYGRNWHRDTVSNYSARSNRCYVELTDSNESAKEYTRDLYDGQTRDLLASTKTHGDPCCRHNSVGMIFIDNNLDTVGDCKDGGDCGYAKVNDFIDQKMKREE